MSPGNLLHFTMGFARCWAELASPVNTDLWKPKLHGNICCDETFIRELPQLEDGNKTKNRAHSSKSNSLLVRALQWDVENPGLSPFSVWFRAECWTWICHGPGACPDHCLVCLFVCLPSTPWWITSKGLVLVPMQNENKMSQPLKFGEMKFLFSGFKWRMLFSRSISILFQASYTYNIQSGSGGRFLDSFRE